MRYIAICIYLWWVWHTHVWFIY